MGAVRCEEDSGADGAWGMMVCLSRGICGIMGGRVEPEACEVAGKMHKGQSGALWGSFIHG